MNDENMCKDKVLIDVSIKFVNLLNVIDFCILVVVVLLILRVVWVFIMFLF